MKIDDGTVADQVKAERRWEDAVFGFATAILSVIFITFVIPAAVVSPSSVKAVPLLPTFLPYVVSGLVGFLGLVCGFQTVFGPGVPKEPGDGPGLRKNWLLRLVLVLAVFLIYYLLPEEAGMLPVSIAVMGFLVWLGGETRLWQGLATSVLLPILVYLFFTEVAQVPLPQGIIEDWM